MTIDRGTLDDRAMAEMLKFGKDVIEYQTRDLRREEFDYSLFGFQIMCQGFMVGAMMVISERFTFSTAARKVALLGCLKYLLEEHGWRLKNARDRIAMFNEVEANPESIGDLCIKTGYDHWRKPDALKTLCMTQKPEEWWSQSWLETKRVRWVRVIRWTTIGVIIIVSILVVLLLSP